MGYSEPSLDVEIPRKLQRHTVSRLQSHVARPAASSCCHTQLQRLLKGFGGCGRKGSARLDDESGNSGNMFRERHFPSNCEAFWFATCQSFLWLAFKLEAQSFPWAFHLFCQSTPQADWKPLFRLFHCTLLQERRLLSVSRIGLGGAL